MRLAVATALAVGVVLGALVVGAVLVFARGGSEGAVESRSATTEEADTQGLPEPVARTRAELLGAAEEGDHDRLAELATGDFNYTFGAPAEGGPAAYWRQLETQGERPLEALAAVLRLPYALAGGVYVWPFAHASDPAALTDYERGLLERIPGGVHVGDTGYLGWRAGIAPDGAWRFFVAGD